MKISFIIGALAQTPELQECVTSIEEASGAVSGFETEIIVVFQNAGKESTLRVKRGDILRCLFMDRKGLSVARNAGIKKSAGDYLVFLDDHAGIRNDFLKVLSEVLRSGNPDALCGKLVDKKTGEVYNASFQNTGQKRLGKFQYRYFMGSAHIVRKDAFAEVGLYDEDFGVGCRFYGAEESDLFFRMMRRHKTVLRVPELVFYHPVHAAADATKIYYQYFAMGAMLEKQVLKNPACAFAGLFFLAEIILKASLRVIQLKLGFAGMKEKNEKFQFTSVVPGTLAGVRAYLASVKEPKAD